MTPKHNQTVFSIFLPIINTLLNKLILGYRYSHHYVLSGFYHLGKNITFNKGIIFISAGNIFLGDRVYIDNYVTLKYLKETEPYDSNRPNIIIDDDVTIGTGTIISAVKQIHIKKGVLIASNCYIGDHDHQYININVPINNQGYRSVKEIVIEKGAWIGANCTICSGVTIGKNAVVGANSVVVNNIPSCSVAVGVPAKVIKIYDTSKKEWRKYT